LIDTQLFIFAIIYQLLILMVLTYSRKENDTAYVVL